MTITADIVLDPLRLDQILSENSHLPNLKAIADHDFTINLRWSSDETLRIEGDMASITALVDKWRPCKLEFIKFTEDDEL